MKQLTLLSTLPCLFLVQLIIFTSVCLYSPWYVKPEFGGPQFTFHLGEEKAGYVSVHLFIRSSSIHALPLGTGKYKIKDQQAAILPVALVLFSCLLLSGFPFLLAFGYFSSFSCFYGFTSSFYCYSCPFSSHHVSCCLSSSVGPHPTRTLSGLRLILVSRENNLGPNNPSPQGTHRKILETKYPKVFLLLILS